MSEKQKVIQQLKNDPLMPLRHTAEHVLHTAMDILHPKTKKVMGPPIRDGFYFDFDLEGGVTEEDLPKLEEIMQKIIDADLNVEMKEISEQEARELFADNKYKLETIDEIVARDEKITICELGSQDYEFHDIDLCAGPHVDSTGKIKAFKLLNIAGAYHKGNENNKMLTRIYGTAFGSPKELRKYLKFLEEAKERDHRKIGKELDLFTFSEIVGKGLVMYTPKGTIIKNQLKSALFDISKKYGAMEVNIPHMAKIDLYELSGHADKFKEELFYVKSHYDEEFVLKPVNCPHHTQIYASQPRSYRDLPLRYIESTQQHRDEKPGAMAGLNRTRSFEIDDGHTFCTIDQVKNEVISLIKIIEQFYTELNMWGNHWVSLSFRDPGTPEKFIGEIKDWEKAENMLSEINEELELGGKEMPGEAALYGPKIDFMLRDAMGNDRQLGTVQIDFAMPQRFNLTYTDSDGEEKTPVMIHRAILGSYGRFIANLLESTKGALPVWLSPVQVAIIPISDTQLKYAQKIGKQLLENYIRIEIYDRDDTMQNKIRQAQEQKVPYMAILGGREEENNTVSMRTREGKQNNGMEIDDFIEYISKKIDKKEIDL